MGPSPYWGSAAIPNLALVKGDIRDEAAVPGCSARLDPPPGRDRRLSGLRRRPPPQHRHQRRRHPQRARRHGAGPAADLRLDRLDLRQGRRRGDRGNADRPADALRQDQAQCRDADPRLGPGACHPPLRHRLRQLAPDAARPPDQRLRLPGHAQPPDRPVRGPFPPNVPAQHRCRRGLSVRDGELRRRCAARSSTSATSR